MSSTINTASNISEKIFEYIEFVRNATFKESLYADIVSTKSTATGTVSIIFCGLKAFDCTPKKNSIEFRFKTDYFKMFNDAEIPVIYEVKNVKSLKDYTRIYIPNNISDFEKIIDYVFTFCEKYVNEHYVPDHLFDCCHRYMECSDMKQCTCPNFLYSKGCSYKKRLESGIVFFGKNRNI